MNQFLLSLCLIIVCHTSFSQKEAEELPVGKYETVLKDKQLKWEKGDIIIIDEHQYRISTSNEIGEYRFSVTAQRIFFTSGPLKTIYATTTVDSNRTAIVLPVSENKQTLKLSSEIWGYYKN